VGRRFALVMTFGGRSVLAMTFARGMRGRYNIGR
jgi:hypothetical protein